jgi:hypothetical protein
VVASTRRALLDAGDVYWPRADRRRCRFAASLSRRDHDGAARLGISVLDPEPYPVGIVRRQAGESARTAGRSGAPGRGAAAR